jgi:hypothetical protein
MARLSEDEFHDNASLLKSYGLAYEAAIFDGSIFSFFPDYCFVMIRLDLGNENRLVKFTQIEPVFKHMSRDPYAELVIMSQEGRSSKRHFMLPPGLKTGGYSDRNPFLKRRLQEIQREGKQVNYSAEAYLICFDIYRQEERIGTISAIQLPSDDSNDFRFIKHSNLGIKAKLDFQIPQALIDQLCHAAEAARRRQSHSAESSGAVMRHRANLAEAPVETARSVSQTWIDPIED